MSSQLNTFTKPALLLGLCLAVGLVGAAWLFGQQLLAVKALDRVVQVKGLSERDVNADMVIWPIKFTEVGDDLAQLMAGIERKNEQVRAFLLLHGFEAPEISVAVPQIQDRQAGYQDGNSRQARYTVTSTLSVYSNKVDQALLAMPKLIELSKNGIAIAGQDYDAKPEFLYSELNQLKPQMIEEATKNGRAVAEKFAADAGSQVGKIRSANQGQFSIADRDTSTPHIKKVRVVSTLEFYLTD